MYAERIVDVVDGELSAGSSCDNESLAVTVTAGLFPVRPHNDLVLFGNVVNVYRLYLAARKRGILRTVRNVSLVPEAVSVGGSGLGKVDVIRSGMAFQRVVVVCIADLVAACIIDETAPFLVVICTEPGGQGSRREFFD